jgi:hypothetical protein
VAVPAGRARLATKPAAIGPDFKPHDESLHRIEQSRSEGATIVKPRDNSHHNSGL